MKNVIVASFKEESQAIEALHKLYELDSYGDIIIFEQIMVRKNADGKTEILKQDDKEGWRTITAMGVGSMLGLFGGPVGFVIGLFTGTTFGVIADTSHYDFAKDFIAKVKQKIEPGTVTIIAEVEEDSAVFIDNELKLFGAVINRSDAELEFDIYVDEQIDEVEDEIAEQRDALKKAVGQNKKKIQTKIAELKEKRRAKIAEFVAKSNEVKENIKSKAVSDIANFKSGVEVIGNRISGKMKKERIELVKRRISRHEDTLTELNMQLKELQA